MRLYTLFFAISEIIINSLMKSISELRNTFSFKIHKTINTLYLSKENTIFL